MCHSIPDEATQCRLTELSYSYSWANEVCAGDNEERAVVISSMNGFQYAVAAWLPIVIFPQTMAPDFRKLCNASCPILESLLTQTTQDTDSRLHLALSSHRSLASSSSSFSCCETEKTRDSAQPLAKLLDTAKYVRRIALRNLKILLKMEFYVQSAAARGSGSIWHLRNESRTRLS